MTEARKDILSWDEYFMGIALISALRSKDPNTQVGSCIASPERKVVSIGYNGMPRFCDESKLTWNKNEGLDSKYLYVCHAEFNAILNSSGGLSLKGCTLYVTLFPCNECAKAIIQTGIKEVVYISDKYNTQVSTQASKKLFDLAGVKYRQYQGRTLSINLK
ncbi:MAG: dCMP deaminase family protein [Bacilli bacterium]|nr:dCMP deaminase family protein [Bacilli bacterium]